MNILSPDNHVREWYSSKIPVQLFQGCRFCLSWWPLVIIAKSKCPCHLLMLLLTTIQSPKQAWCSWIACRGKSTASSAAWFACGQEGLGWGLAALQQGGPTCSKHGWKDEVAVSKIFYFRFCIQYGLKPPTRWNQCFCWTLLKIPSSFLCLVLHASSESFFHNAKQARDENEHVSRWSVEVNRCSLTDLTNLNDNFE